ncbi:type I phosphomannose isomerase catalytic subunit [Planctomicrobium sp. SH668]|uniref:type I phosphomannose isomerase catalytic subunit n=1 Tax=Planctomicrobium sp. SH668 TaxID=3448126 RepID=UPI003F5B4BDD
MVDPIRFLPIIKRALWGGERLEKELNKQCNGVPDAAESWEVSDIPGSVSIVADGEFAGVTLRELMEGSAQDLLGQHADEKQFPLLIKFLDAREQLSLQVHPKDPVAMPDGSIRPGKTESWIVIAADAGNKLYLGLNPEVTEQVLRESLETGDLERHLNQYTAHAGDCIHLSPGTFHALGGGLLIAEIQQPSDIKYRIYDWKRVDANGNSRELHIEQGFASADFERGPVSPVIPQPSMVRQGSELLVDCPFYRIARHTGSEPLTIADDNSMHVLVVLSGEADQDGFVLERGQVAVLPAAREKHEWCLSENAIVLDSYLPPRNS